MQLTQDGLKRLAAALFILPLLAIFLLGPPSSAAPPAPEGDFDAAAAYKTKCAMCHGQKAEKKFDAAKAEEVHVEAILKGVNSQPVKMPGYEAKGVTAEQAGAYVALMKSLKQ
jgi:mono/diheme cytochrome c family protein